MKKISIGNAGGYWGDDPQALKRQILGGRLDYISMDFLAEVTMSIMQKQRSNDPTLGYARDFLPMIEPVLKKALEQKTKIITNAGGVNPLACAEALLKLAEKQGLKLKVSVVYGDDVLPDIPGLQKSGAAFANMETGQKFADVCTKIEAANVYFGALPVVEALKDNPDIVITGRVTDTGITLAAMIHEFQWELDDWDKLASGIIAGHIIECGAQATGGNFTDWKKIKSFANMGYPIIEMQEDGVFTVTKHPFTGGLVSVDTVREQLVYEMGNPTAYLTPDVVADFSSAELKAEGENRVRVFNVKGYEPTPFYKVSMAYTDGYKCIGAIAISGPEARAKAECFAQIFWDRVGIDFLSTHTEYFGWNACHQSLGLASEGNEIILRLGARDLDEKKLKIFSKLIPSLILGGPPGVCVLGGAPKVSEVVSYWPALMDKKLVNPSVAMLASGQTKIHRKLTHIVSGQFKSKEAHIQVAEKITQDLSTCLANRIGKPLSEICLGRSGDKGDTSNIGILARSDDAYAYIKKNLTAEVVKNLFQEICHGAVTRYEIDNLKALNFLLDNSLGGGGTVTLRADAQGKTYAQALLRQKFDF